jgi:Lrp/AsnC family transcriptional regulator, leucine-responsive regulatory protein
MPAKTTVNGAPRLENDRPVLDETAWRILDELGADPRVSMSELGRRIGMSAPAVTERVQRLERCGVIRYRLDVDPAALGHPIAAWIRVRPALGHMKTVEQMAVAQAEVVECHKITGEDCLLMRVQVRDVADLDRVLEGWQEHASTVTSVIKSTPVEPRNMLTVA